MESSNNKDELVFENVMEPGLPLRRIARLKTTGIIVLELVFDTAGREIEKRFFDHYGCLSRITRYQYDNERRPILVTSFDKNGKLLMRQARGKQPELFEE